LSASSSIITFHSESPEQTARIGDRLAGVLRPGDVLLLEGELGAGKTTLVRAVCTALGVGPGEVSSPTFVTVNEYEGREHVIVHADGYRLLRGDDAGDSDSLGLDALDPSAILMIEWGERIMDSLGSLASRPVARVRIRHTGIESREIRLEWSDAWPERPQMAELRALASV